MELNIINFCEKRFDIVIRYHFLRQCNFEVHKASDLFNNDKYDFLRDVFRQVNPRLLKKGVFDPKRWSYVETAIARNQNWLKANPYRLNSTNYGYNAKRLLMAIKYENFLYWYIDDSRAEKEGFLKDDYVRRLPDSFIEELKQSELHFVQTVNRLGIFSESTRLYSIKRMKYKADWRFYSFIEKLCFNLKIKWGTLNKHLIGVTIWQSGEPYFNSILKTISKYYSVHDIIRYSTTDQQVFMTKMDQLYAIDPSNKDKVIPKLLSLGEETSFWFLICSGNPNWNKKLKTKIREKVGINCLHTTEHSHMTAQALKLLFQYNQDQVDIILEKRGKLLTKKNDIFHQSKIKLEGKTKENKFDTINEVFTRLNKDKINYVIISFGEPLDELIAYGKDIEIITTSPISVIDCLGATYLKKQTVYQIFVSGMAIKLDFYLSYNLPVNWNKHMLATKEYDIFYKYFKPKNIEEFWSTLYERTILKPYKFKNNERYPEGNKWDDLIYWGNSIGVTSRLSKDISRFECVRRINNYLAQIGVIDHHNVKSAVFEIKYNIRRVGKRAIKTILPGKLFVALKKYFHNKPA